MSVQDEIKNRALSLVVAMTAADRGGQLTEHQRRALGAVKQLAGIPTNMDRKRSKR